MDLSEQFRDAFLRAAGSEDFRDALKEASLTGRLGEWTSAITMCSAQACKNIGLRASAKGNRCELLPINRSEYLGLDVMAFREGENRWLFPSIIMELENSQDEDKIAYSLWKILCVRADLRFIFCYRKEASAAPVLVRHLRKEVIDAMGLQGRVNLDGRTFVVVGSRNDADTFPFGFFKWWELNTQTGQFDSF